MGDVVMFSGGKGSWAAARHRRDVDGVDPADMVLLFTDTNGEDPDLYRFLVEGAADLFGVTLPDGMAAVAPYDAATLHLPGLVWVTNNSQTIWDVFRRERMIGNTRLSVCSRALKQRPARKWLEANTDPADTTVVVGIDWTESHRVPTMERNYQPWAMAAPLTQPGAWSKDRVDAELEAVGIAQPRLYAQGFPHNNCAGACVRGGQGQWALLLEKNPERYAEEEAQEAAFRAETGKDVAILRDRRGGATKPLTLAALRHRVEHGGDVDPLDLGGCGCTTDLSMEDETNG